MKLSSVIFTVIVRTLLFVSLPATLLAILYNGFPLQNSIAVVDFAQFFLGGCLVLASWRPAVNLFIEPEIRSGSVFYYGLTSLGLSLMGAVVWSVSWRATGHSPAYGDNLVRLTFRFLAVNGLVSLLATTLGPYQETIRIKTWIPVVVVVFCAVLTAGLLLYREKVSDNVQDWIGPHDVKGAPAPDLN